jgi:HTH-type transcriptional regulator/antitoxin HigA
MLMGFEVQEECKHFSRTIAPFLSITDKSQYKDSLQAVEYFLEQAGDTLDDPLNPIIDMLSQAIETYEKLDPALIAFEVEAEQLPTDVSVLRLLMVQHNLGAKDLPEIGDKSIVSRILNGERELNKKHIKKLAERFGISPSLFF